MKCAMRGWLTLIVLIFAAMSPAAAEPKGVLLLHSFGPQFAPWVFFAGQFREELFKQSPNKIDLYEASLEGSRFLQPAEQSPAVDYLVALFRTKKPRPDCGACRSCRCFCAKIPAAIFPIDSANDRRAGAASNQLRRA